MTPDFEYQGEMMLVISYTFLMHVISKISQLPKQIDFKIDGFIPNDITVYALALPHKTFSLSSDVQRHFDLI